MRLDRRVKREAVVRGVIEALQLRELVVAVVGIARVIGDLQAQRKQPVEQRVDAFALPLAALAAGQPGRCAPRAVGLFHDGRKLGQRFFFALKHHRESARQRLVLLRQQLFARFKLHICLAEQRVLRGDFAVIDGITCRRQQYTRGRGQVMLLQLVLARLAARRDLRDEIPVGLGRGCVIGLAGHQEVAPRELLVQHVAQFVPVAQELFQLRLAGERRFAQFIVECLDLRQVGGIEHLRHKAPRPVGFQPGNVRHTLLSISTQ